MVVREFYFCLWLFSFAEYIILNLLVFQGAPEGLLDRCTHVRVGQNKVPMSPAIKNEIMKLTKTYGTGKALMLWTRNISTP